MADLARVTEVLRAGSWSAETAIDSLCLTYDERHRRRLRYTAIGGTTFLLDLARATVLAAGDGLRLDDGRVVHVDAAPEALMEVTAPDTATLIKLAWHIGNRHLAAQLEPDRIVIRDDPVIAHMLIGLGAAVSPMQAAFSPESGAYHDHSDLMGHLAHRHGNGNAAE
jgi:urease accessory protein